jgi:hypothetical protein
VNDSELTYEEIQQACRACRWIRIPSSPEAYLREFLAFRLDQPAPALASKIRRLTSQQFEGLCRVIRDKQEGAP